MNGPQSDIYNIMLASLGTTPLKIIYAGRLEYARVCVCKYGGVNETCGERRKGGPPMNFWLLKKGDFILHLPFWNSFLWEVNSFKISIQRVRSFWEQILIFHPVHTAPSTVLLWLICYWPCRNPLWFHLWPHAKVANWITRSANSPNTRAQF
jgi:hypothetical protein